jgi:mycothiol synthase
MRIRRSDYDPELWQLALEGERVVGLGIGFGANEFGWMLDLAVETQYRGRGIGLALLRACFRELQRKGHTNVGLEVDSENETGATRLYERAGMSVTRRYATYEKRFEEAA